MSMVIGRSLDGNIMEAISNHFPVPLKTHTFFVKGPQDSESGYAFATLSHKILNPKP